LTKQQVEIHDDYRRSFRYRRGTARSVQRVALLWVFGGFCGLQAAEPLENTITVVVSDGPFAGSYTARNTACVHIKDRNTLGCGWKEFAKYANAKRLEEAGIQVDVVSKGPGARTGDVVVKFVDGNGAKVHDYSLTNVSMTFTHNGAVQQLSFDGKTKDGTRMRVVGTLAEVEEF
jgi:hypothetical protein